MKKISKDGLRLCDLQARTFEVSVELTTVSSEVFIRRFMNSKVAKTMDNESSFGLVICTVIFAARMN